MSNKPTIKIDFCGFWIGFDKENNLFSRILSKHFKIIISDEPDYLFVSPLNETYDYLAYDCIRIFFAGEELVPDFNLYDYAIGFDDIVFGDRYYRYPLCFYRNSNFWEYEMLSMEEAKELLTKKDIFCNFIYNEDSIGGYRKQLFDAINKYKRVESYGRYLNNTNGTGVSYSEKYEILKRSKFTIAIEGCNYPGVATEKITHPLINHSVPIYYGNKNISDDFNERSFINCHKYSNIDSIVERIIELDKNDNKYLDVITTCPLIENMYAKELYYGLEQFLLGIFSQDLEKCKRRVDSLMSRLYIYRIKELSREKDNSLVKKIKKRFERREKA